MAKPAFDPNKPFEAATSGGKKPAFDASQPFEPLEENYLSVEPEPSMLSKIGSGAANAVIAAGKAVDSVTGAPTRAAIGAIQDGKGPLSAFASQFASDPGLAPSGKQLAIKGGMSEERPLVMTARQQQEFNQKFNPGLADVLQKSGADQEDIRGASPAGIAGLAIDIGADPTNLIPGAALLKGAGKGVSGGAKILGKGAMAAAKIAKPVIQKAPVIGKTFDVAEGTVQSIKGALNSVFKPTQAADFPQMVAIAEKHGIDPKLLPSSVEYGPGTFISRADRNLREGPFGQPELELFHEGHAAVQGAATNYIQKLANGAPVSEIEAGGLIKKGYDDAVERLFEDVDFTYNSVIDQVPGARLTPQAQAAVDSKLLGAERIAKGMLQRGITNTERGQAQQILRAVEAVRAGNGSLKQTYEAMSQIGRHAFKKGGQGLADTPVDQKKFQDIYFSLRDAFINSTATHLGDDAASKLIDSNQQISMFLENKAPIGKLLDNNYLAPERLFNSLIINGDSKKIVSLKEMLSPEQLAQVKGAVLENLIKRDADGAFNFGTLHSAMRNKRNVLESLFEPQEIVEFGELVKLGDSFGPAVLSTSGTGASNLFRDLGKGIVDNATSRAVITGLKDQARGKTVAAPATRPQLAPGRSFQRPSRGSGEEAAKVLQGAGATAVSNEKEEKTAVQKRLEALKRARGQ